MTIAQNVSQTATIREALGEDLDRIVELHNRWSLANLHGKVDRGFLLVETSPRQIEAVHTGENSILVACIADEVVGYLIATRVPELMERLNWQENVASSISGPGHRHVTEMAVDPDFTGRGLGKKLYDHLLRNPGNLHFSAYVATSPLRNSVSVAFHKNMGFRTVATFTAPEFCGLKEYSSVLFFKQNPPST